MTPAQEYTKNEKKCVLIFLVGVHSASKDYVTFIEMARIGRTIAFIVHKRDEKLNVHSGVVV